jgi:aspartyl-tRNA(Asn)/glutamyl-tRNA(Gln) amidotransferase subunit A
MEAAMSGVDAFLTPSTQTAAITLDAIDYKEQPTRFARFVNLLDQCALALPNGFTAGGLPTSLQIACRGYEEALALRIGHAYQESTDWHERIPPAVCGRTNRKPASVEGRA